jgi:hypothetical protein
MNLTEHIPDDLAQASVPETSISDAALLRRWWRRNIVPVVSPDRTCYSCSVFETGHESGMPRTKCRFGEAPPDHADMTFDGVRFVLPCTGCPT